MFVQLLFLSSYLWHGGLLWQRERQPHSLVLCFIKATRLVKELKAVAAEKCLLAQFYVNLGTEGPEEQGL